MSAMPLCEPSPAIMRRKEHALLSQGVPGALAYDTTLYIEMQATAGHRVEARLIGGALVITIPRAVREHAAPEELDLISLRAAG